MNTYQQLDEALIDALKAGAEKIGTDAYNKIKELVSSKPKLPEHEWDQVAYYVNLAFKEKEKGNKEKYLELLNKAVFLTQKFVRQNVSDRIDEKKIKGEVKMLITEGKLKQIINEEIQSMIESGEVDEGLLDLFKAGAQKIGGDVSKKAGEKVDAAKTAVGAKVQAASDAVKRVKNSAEQYKKEVIQVAKTASTKADINGLVDNADKQVSGLYEQMLALQQRAKALQIPVDFTQTVKFLQGAIGELKKVKTATAQAAAEE